ncbi:ABC transporter ATP-binding protein [Yoonia sp. 2307UL14-13]|uniref:ABC transporter ATP-binding protein n=1 Tax=Yoonia sp. 2307UL14-13 TaxID=3126506 RepID=UPI0030B0A005
MIETYRKVLSLFNAKERRGFYLLMVMMVFVAFAEVIGISSVLVFLNLLASPEQIGDSAIFSAIYDYFGFASNYSFMIFMSFAVFGVVLASLGIKGISAYVLIRFANMRGYALACRLFGIYLHRPYSWFLTKNSAEIARNVLSEMDYLVFTVIVPLLMIISGAISAIAIISFLIVVDPFVSFLSAGLLGGSYALLYLVLRPIIYHSGRQRLLASDRKYRIVGEATGGFKQVKLQGLEDNYTGQFDGPAHDHARYAARNQILGELPRFALEALTFGIMLTLILVLLLRSDGDLIAIIPTLGIFAFAVIRILPAIQQIYHSLVSVRGGEELLNHMVAESDAAQAATDRLPTETGATQPLPLNDSLQLSNIGFGYEKAQRPALTDLNLTIKARTTIGIVGGTGAGKTTLIDLILGLLPIQDGTMEVDGTAITNDTRRAWQQTIGYVPQDIYLIDDNIARNVAFGIPPDQIDMEAVEQAARIAALHDFVMTELPDGYDTMVGERGVRLSGGQRQRIGIARALYTNPSLLIMDEATSALDNITERVVMEAVHNIRSDKTVIMIAHRLTTVKECDQIFLMEHGKIVSHGTYDELVAENETFRKMAQG